MPATKEATISKFPNAFHRLFRPFSYRITADATTRKWEKDSEQKFLVSCTLLERIIYIIYTGDWKYYSLNDIKRTKDKIWRSILSPKNYSHYWTIEIIFCLHIYILTDTRLTTIIRIASTYPFIKKLFIIYLFIYSSIHLFIYI